MKNGCGTRLSDGRWANLIEEDDGRIEVTIGKQDADGLFVVTVPPLFEGSPDDEARNFSASFVPSPLEGDSDE